MSMLLCPRRRSALLSVVLSTCGLALLVPGASQARITRIDAKVVESPTFGGGNDPTTAEDAGDGCLMHQGYTILEAGWDATVAPGEGRFRISVPTARDADGSSIVGA
jgi:hypothetical protein